MKTLTRLLDRRLRQYSRAAILLIAAACLLVIGIPDYFFGTEISFSIFYIAPVSLATWYAGEDSGALIALLSALPLLAEQLNAARGKLHPALIFWNVFLQAGTMLILVLLLGALLATLQREQERARIDPVTGILNRFAFFERLELSLGLMTREAVTFGLAYIDLDDFKAVNDRGGHSEGDRVLRLVARTLQESIRHSDTAARLGGDEFSLLIYGVDCDEARVLLDKVQRALRNAFIEEHVAVTCSVGCIVFQASATDVGRALRAADRLMYQVKRHGKNRIEVADFGRDQAGT